MKRLQDHRRVGWDMDGTLFQHQNSEAFADFIRRNPYDQDFYIVTFRSHGIEKEVEPDLATLGLKLSDFKGILNVPDRIYAEYWFAMKHWFTGDTMPEEVDRYLTWKGKICRQNGITILLDDLTSLVEIGCERHSVDMIHPNDLEV